MLIEAGPKKTIGTYPSSTRRCLGICGASLVLAALVKGCQQKASHTAPAVDGMAACVCLCLKLGLLINHLEDGAQQAWSLALSTEMRFIADEAQ